MNLKDSLNRRLRSRSGSTDLNLTAVMNIFLILIPFLLLTATFVRIAVLELWLPSRERYESQSMQSQPDASSILNILKIQENGFELKSPNMDFEPLARTQQGYPWQQLRSQLEQVKEKYPDVDDIIIAPDNSIRYDTIISVMDQCRESGFPNISVSG